MKRTLAVTIDAGDTSCSPCYGTWCQFVTVRLGEHPRCTLYDVDLAVDGGWIRRTHECREAEAVADGDR